MRLAMLKRPLPGVKHWLAHHVGALVDHGPYSHSNLVFSNGLSGSAWSNGGVDLRPVQYDPARWDFWTLPGVNEAAVHRDMMRLRGTPYDHLGAARFGLVLLPEHPLRFFCHELIATIFGWPCPSRIGPMQLVGWCRHQFGSEPVPGPWP